MDRALPLLEIVVVLLIIIGAVVLVAVLVFFLEPGIIALPYSLLTPLFVRNPPFVDMDRVFPKHRLIEEAYPAIRAEAQALLRDPERIPLFHEVDKLQKVISDRDEIPWRTLFLKGYGLWHDTNVNLTPKTVEVLRQIPEIDTAMLSILGGGKHIPRHRGFYKGVYRYHLGLIVPDDAPVYIVCGGQEYHWREGEGVLFDDTYRHEVWNRSEHPRVVLFLSILRDGDLPRWLRPINRMVRSMIQRSPKLKRAGKRAEVATDI